LENCWEGGGEKVEVHILIHNIKPCLFYLLDYGFLPQNVSEVGGKKKIK
jgi:hypothetical protein